MTNKNEVDAYESSADKNMQHSNLQEEHDTTNKNRHAAHREKIADVRVRIKGTAYEIDEIHSSLNYKNEVSECAKIKIRIELI